MPYSQAFRGPYPGRGKAVMVKASGVPFMDDELARAVIKSLKKSSKREQKSWGRIRKAQGIIDGRNRAQLLGKSAGSGSGSSGGGGTGGSESGKYTRADHQASLQGIAGWQAYQQRSKRG